MKLLLIAFLCFPILSQAQQPAYRHNAKLTSKLQKILVATGLDSSYDVGEGVAKQVSVAVIVQAKKPVFAGVRANEFIYPASIYKMYVAMEVLKQVHDGRYALDSLYIVRSPNDVDRSKEIASDPRPLLRAGDTVTVNYLLDLMITRSDNAAANCLIDLAGRERINKTMIAYGWQGSEVTRKFLSRKLEDPGYENIRGTETNARHAAEFMWMIETNRLINPWVSMQLKALLARQLDYSKLAGGFPTGAMFSHKTGWWSHYTHDVGIVQQNGVTYTLAVFTPVREERLNGRLQLLAQKIHAMLQKEFQ
ncbi:MAG: serine hydrolase [Chitinophagaceae bacterium]|nr:MAG: serine hydrolase [Chitinophagaceae bacterium]